MVYKVTEKNMMSVMGKINTFFRKNVVEDKGIKKIPVGEKTCEVDGYKFPITIYEDGQLFLPFIGICTVHPCYKDGFRHVSNVLLSVADKYSNNCIPIYDGAKVELKGTMLRIQCMWPGCGINPKYTTFIQRDYSKEERIKHIARRLASTYADNLFEADSFEGSNKHCNTEWLSTIVRFVTNTIDEISSFEDLQKNIEVVIDSETMSDNYDYYGSEKCPAMKVVIDLNNYINKATYKEQYSFVFEDKEYVFSNILENI